jgi:hypothetical protein
VVYEGKKNIVSPHSNRADIQDPYAFDDMVRANLKLTDD